jgi:thiamine pyrophosphate-dependent acetolactate synthase large subunit-like protein
MHMADDGEHDVISGGHLVTKALKTEGVDVIFTLCGGHITDMVDVRHEQVATYAADGRTVSRSRDIDLAASQATSGRVDNGAVGRKTWLKELRGVENDAFEKGGGDIVTFSGQAAKYGEQRARVGNARGDVPYDQFATMPGGYGEEVRDPADIRPALERARNSGQPSLINVWVDPEVYAPGTMNQTMYK